jgi:hypothetical protein
MTSLRSDIRLFCALLSAVLERGRCVVKSCDRRRPAKLVRCKNIGSAGRKTLNRAQGRTIPLTRCRPPSPHVLKH